MEEIDKQWLRAASTQDTGFLKQFFADGMFEVQRGGVVESGEGMRKAIGTPGRHVQIDIDNVVVRGIYGDTRSLRTGPRKKAPLPMAAR